jgi:hypothetical protein
MNRVIRGSDIPIRPASGDIPGKKGENLRWYGVKIIIPVEKLLRFLRRYFRR